jgi:hypothetical protein
MARSKCKNDSFWRALICAATFVGFSIECFVANAQTASPQANAATSEQQILREYYATHPYLHDEFSPGEGGVSGIDDLMDIQEPETPFVDTDVVDGPLSFVRGKLDTLYKGTGLRMGLAYTALGIFSSGADDPGGAAQDIDLMAAWTLVGRDTKNSGVLVATTEYRAKFGNDPASSVGPDLGTLINTTNAFNDRRWVLRDTYWLQRLLDGKLRILFGRADTSDFVGLQPMQNINASFVNRSFSANPSVPFPGHGMTLGVSARPNSEFYVTGGLANGYNDTTAYEWDEIGHGDFFYTLEAGATPTIQGLGTGRYSVMGWYINSRRDNGLDSPSDRGVSLVGGQQLSERLQVWGRYAYAHASTTNIAQLYQAGMGYGGLLGSPSNLTGFAASFAQPRTNASRDEKVLELFHRQQVTRFMQISIGAQQIWDLGNNPDEDSAQVYFARLRFAL